MSSSAEETTTIASNDRIVVQGRGEVETRPPYLLLFWAQLACCVRRWCGAWLLRFGLAKLTRSLSGHLGVARQRDCCSGICTIEGDKHGRGRQSTSNAPRCAVRKMATDAI